MSLANIRALARGSERDLGDSLEHPPVFSPPSFSLAIGVEHPKRQIQQHHRDDRIAELLSSLGCLASEARLHRASFCRVLLHLVTEHRSAA